MAPPPIFPAGDPRPISLLTCTVALPLTLVVLAPHPDDFDAIAVTLQHFHRRGALIHLAVLTTGASGVEHGFAGAIDDVRKAALREQEQRDSCRFFGLPAEHISFLRLPADSGGNPQLDAANRQRIRDYLLPLQPDMVFMPHGNDSNVTHQRTYALFRAVALAHGLHTCALLNKDAKTIAMRTDAYMPFDAETAEWKGRLLRLHRSQHQRNLNTRGHGFDERVLAICRQSAQEMQLAQPYAEIFELERFAAGAQPALSGSDYGL
jgi:LmbE family N-acetylglucosaminyl deacetylase